MKKITIAEYAEAVGISKQAVYQKLNKSLKPYLVIENGKKYLKISVLDEAINHSNSTVFKPLNKTVEKVDSTLNNELEKILKEKDKIIEILERQNETLTRLLEESQEALKRSQEIQMKSQGLQENSQVLLGMATQKDEPKDKVIIQEPVTNNNAVSGIKGLLKKVFK